MRVGLLSLSDANITRVLKRPALAWQLITPKAAAAESPQQESAKPAGRGKKKVATRRTKAKAVPELKLAVNEGMRCDLDKSWHGIHYLLTGSAWESSPPLDFLVDGGRQVGRIDSEHGPLRAFRAKEVQPIYESLSSIGPYELRKRFNARDMTAKEIYPDIWTRAANEEDSLRYLMDNLDRLRAFLHETLEAGLGILVFLI